jgi:uncharacterized protein with ParB-like and HNH nuclease domain
MVKRIEFLQDTKKGYTINVTNFYFLGILFYSVNKIEDAIVVY